MAEPALLYGQTPENGLECFDDYATIAGAVKSALESWWESEPGDPDDGLPVVIVQGKRVAMLTTEFRSGYTGTVMVQHSGLGGIERYTVKYIFVDDNYVRTDVVRH